MTGGSQASIVPGPWLDYPGPWLDYIVVDVFVSPSGSGAARGLPYTGNPLAVVLGGDALSTAQCQALSREFHLSETVFPMAATVAAADYRARIFTIASELPFAGHPSVGAAWVLGQLGRFTDHAGGRVVQQCDAGLVALEVPTDGGAVRLTGPVPTMSAPVDPAALLEAVGLAPSDLTGHPPRIGGSGVSFAFLQVRPDALARARPDLAALARLPLSTTGVLFFAFTGEGTGSIAVPIGIQARMFAADIGGEDPATGSAALGLGGWLVASGIAAGDGLTAYSIDQGVEMGRPSRLRCDVTTEGGKITGVTVSGQVAVVANGRIRIP